METSRLELVRLEGGPAARGRQHGELFRIPIRELLDRWDEALERVYKIRRSRYVERFYAETGFEAALERYAPAVLEEVRGIAQGADADYKTLLAFQHVNEEFWLALPSPQPREACSTIALGKRGTQPTLIGQNLDLDSYLDGYQVLLSYPCDRSEGQILAVSVPGMISLNGLNSHGFAVCDNALTQLRGDTAGLPIFAIYRLVLESPSVRDAVELLQRLPHASGLNWVMGDPHEVAMYEISAGGAVRYGPGDPAKPIYHTNHPLVNGDLAASFCDAIHRPASVRPTRSTYLRLAVLHEAIVGLRGELTIKAIETILSSRRDRDYPVSRGGGRNEEDEAIGFTLACCIFELEAGQPKLHIAAGPPHVTPFQTFAVPARP